MWQKSENGENVLPQSVEYSGDIVIVRKNFELVRETDERPEHYEYDEWQMTKEQYEVYETFHAQMEEQSDALVELAELISEVL